MQSWLRRPLLLVTVTLACEDDGEEADEGLECEEEEEEEGDEGPIGPDSESTCPTTDPPTYENFGQAFMESYCTRCHSSELMGDARMCAPLFHDFDTLEGILPVLDHIDQYAAAGPAATNTEMPENGAMPTLEERQRLGEWLACEIAKM